MSPHKLGHIYLLLQIPIAIEIQPAIKNSPPIGVTMPIVPSPVLPLDLSAAST